MENQQSPQDKGIESRRTLDEILINEVFEVETAECGIKHVISSGAIRNEEDYRLNSYKPNIQTVRYSTEQRQGLSS